MLPARNAARVLSAVSFAIVAAVVAITLFFIPLDSPTTAAAPAPEPAPAPAPPPSRFSMPTDDPTRLSRRALLARLARAAPPARAQAARLTAHRVQQVPALCAPTALSHALSAVLQDALQPPTRAADFDLDLEHSLDAPLATAPRAVSVDDVFALSGASLHDALTRGESLAHLVDMASRVLTRLGGAVAAAWRVDAHHFETGAASSSSSSSSSSFPDALRALLRADARNGLADVLVANIHSGIAKGWGPHQGGGHFVVVAGFDPAADEVLVVDVNPVHYGQLWTVPVPRFADALASRDTFGIGRSRGILRIYRAAHGDAARSAAAAEAQTRSSIRGIVAANWSPRRVPLLPPLLQQQQQQLQQQQSPVSHRSTAQLPRESQTDAAHLPAGAPPVTVPDPQALAQRFGPRVLGRLDAPRAGLLRCASRLQGMCAAAVALRALAPRAGGDALRRYERDAALEHWAGAALGEPLEPHIRHFDSASTVAALVSRGGGGARGYVVPLACGGDDDGAGMEGSACGGEYLRSVLRGIAAAYGSSDESGDGDAGAAVVLLMPTRLNALAGATVMLTTGHGVPEAFSSMPGWHDDQAWVVLAHADLAASADDRGSVLLNSVDGGDGVMGRFWTASLDDVARGLRAYGRGAGIVVATRIAAAETIREAGTEKEEMPYSYASSLGTSWLTVRQTKVRHAAVEHMLQAAH